jgi:serine/threonine-protein kinase
VLALRTGDVSGVPFLVMEYCSGGTLDVHLAGRPLPPAEAAAVLRALAGAVHFAHVQGVVHRDLKPSNILLGTDQYPIPDHETRPDWALGIGDSALRPKVADFGLAKCEAGVGSAITATRETLGTPCYMAPELTTGARDADARTDVYGLGGILYELLTGRPPFVATTPLEVIRMVREEAPVRPKRINPDVPAELEELCLKCLEKEPDQRFATAAEVSKGLGLRSAHR